MRKPTTTLEVAELKWLTVLVSQSQEMAPLDCRMIEGGFKSLDIKGHS